MENEILNAWKHGRDCQLRYEALGMVNTYGLSDEDRCALDIEYQEAKDALLESELYFQQALRNR